MLTMINVLTPHSQQVNKYVPRWKIVTKTYMNQLAEAIISALKKDVWT
jgi:hypothetical protein